MSDLATSPVPANPSPPSTATAGGGPHSSRSDSRAGAKGTSLPPANPEPAFHPYPLWCPRFWHGMTLGVWLRLIFRHGLRIHWQRWPMAVAITILAAINSLLGGMQWLLGLIWPRVFADGAADPHAHEPIFILGHWRSGTTHLHELLVQDKRFGYPTTYECFAPAHFLLTEWATPLLKIFLPKKRPMDNMAAGWDHPQEDEFALCNLGVGSPYIQMAFPNEPSYAEDFLDLRGLTPAQLAGWKGGLVWFLRRVATKQRKPLVLKSPPHTARMRTLLELFPRAKFIHIVRDPLAVFPSTVRLWKSLAGIQGLQIARNEGLEESILANFTRMYAAFDADRTLVPAAQFYEVKYEDLVANPLATLETLYRELQLGDFAAVRPAVAAYLETQKDYKTNQLQTSPELREKITTAWGEWMKKFGYASEC